MRPVRPLVVTMGDPAGIGGEILIDAWRKRESVPPFFAIDDPDRLAQLATDVPVRVIEDPASALAAFPVALPVLAHPLSSRIEPGKPDTRSAKAVIGSIDRAVTLAQSGDVAGVVTSPINKKLLYDGANFSFPGHTEYLAHLAGVAQTVMMLCAPGLRVVPVTIHLPLADVPDALTADLLIQTTRIVNSDLKRFFGIQEPRIAVAGLNPHAGEGGAIGREEIEIIEPALRRLADDGLVLTGPLPADTMFHPAAREQYDVALAMYHDQALVPVKMLDFARGVNVTLGLPFVRTSPDHGTAYDIAGKGIADPTSLIEALRLAGEMSKAMSG